MNKKFLQISQLLRLRNIAAKSPDKTRNILMLQIENNIRLEKKNTQTKLCKESIEVAH